MSKSPALSIAETQESVPDISRHALSHTVKARSARAAAADTVRAGTAGRSMLLGRGAGGPICSSWRREASKRFGMYFARRSGVVEPQDDAVDQGETDGEPAVRAASTNLPAAAGGLQPPGVDTPISQGRNGCMWVPKGVVQGFPRVLCARVLCRVGLCGSVVALDHTGAIVFAHGLRCGT